MYRLIVFLLVFIPLNQSFAQSKADLEQKRESIQKEIKLIAKRLQQVKVDKKEALENYLTLQRQIQKRSQLISTLGKEDELLEKRIARTNDGIFSLERDAKILEEEYGALLRQALRQKLSDSYLSFIFSATDFNEALQRWRYLNQYRSFRARQTRIIKETQQSLIRKKEILSVLSLEKEELLAEQLYQQEQLKEESERKNKMYRSLKRNESSLRSDLKDQQEEAFQLKSAILNLIGDNKESIKMAGTTGDMNADFTRSKTKLAWPLKDGFVERFFGRQPHPTLRKIEVVNNGIDIRALSSPAIYASFAGTVAGKFTLPSGMQSVLIKHGDFYTVYSNMDQIFVQQGDQVSTQQEIGTLDPTSKILHFEIWRLKVRLNPMDWLSPQ